MKKHLSTALLLLVLLAGVALLLYPTASDYWNSFHQSRAIAGYAESVSGLNAVDYEQSPTILGMTVACGITYTN